MINLDERPEKYEKCVDILHPKGIYPYRFSGINGWKLDTRIINDLGVHYDPTMPQGLFGTTYETSNGQAQREVVHIAGRSYFAHNMSRGAIGVAMSHLSILQDALDSGYKTIWIMEDDIELIQNPHKISELINKLDDAVGKEKWDVLYTDQDSKDKNGGALLCNSFGIRPDFFPEDPKRFSKRKNVSHDFRRIGARYGTYSMILRRSGMKKILQFLKQHKLFSPYDMDLCLTPGIRLYTVTHDVVSTQPNAASDNWWPGYTH